MPEDCARGSTPRRPGGSSVLRERERELLREVVELHTGVRLDPEQGAMLEGRLRAFVRSQPRLEAAALLARVADRPDGGLARELAEALTNGETSFFRDPLLFDELREWVIPELLRRPGCERLELWCAASSTGQEPYSLAMLLATCFPQLLEPGRLRIIASDVSRHNLARAEAACYSRTEINRGLPAAMLLRWFESTPVSVKGRECFRVRAELREIVELRQLNLLEPWPLLPPLDLVLLRNVSLYWAPPRRKAVLARVADQLAPTGFLALGGTEMLPRDLQRFDLVQPRRWRFFRPRPRAELPDPFEKRDP